MIQEKLNPFKNSFQSVVLMSAATKFERNYLAQAETGILRAGIEVFNELLIGNNVACYEDIKAVIGEAYSKRNELYPHTTVLGRNHLGFPQYIDTIEGKPFTFTEWVVAINSITKSLGFSITHLAWDYEKKIAQ